MKPMKLKLLPPILLLLSVIMCGCGDYRVRLPNQYELVRVSAREFLIADPQKHVIIYPTIDTYKILGVIVLGHVSIPVPPPGPEYTSLPGYFFLNTKTHELKQGLDKKTWLDSLKANGIAEEPSLHKPSRLDKYF